MLKFCILLLYTLCVTLPTNETKFIKVLELRYTDSFYDSFIEFSYIQVNLRVVADII